ncbi:MAG: 23S rRNA (guanosine(2251)-2'-O)-methyltransferase RlmB [Gammaproteobacteria bacterium]|nr:23S rRNA (guanosine(2251)-2'-O)-methyltransferase RlmB [Gammaproteobacteria bacterium]MCH9744699.1 23S rRNA (guanosine(2251)-2'-O)-methyltransferase RlmB [Gammaproteobacteria bacterium]
MAVKNRVYGIHAVKNLLLAKPQLIQQLFVQTQRQDQRMQELLQLAEQQQVAVSRVGIDALDQMFDSAVVHQGVVVECGQALQLSESELYQLVADKQEDCLLLILDGIQDPHNLGACLRSANAMGVDAVVIPKDKAVGVTDTVQKVACGAAALTPVVAVTNLARAMQKFQELGVWTVGLAGEAEETLAQQKLTGNLALVLGSEGTGLRRLTRKHCDYLAKIALYGSVESLNVSVACGIALYEIRRS